jgi:hypothetical protein
VSKNRTPQRPLFVDKPTRTLLVKYAGQASGLIGEQLSLSAMIRFAVAGPLRELMDVLGDLGEPDLAEVRKALLDSMNPKKG